MNKAIWSRAGKAMLIFLLMHMHFYGFWNQSLIFYAVGMLGFFLIGWWIK